MSDFDNFLRGIFFAIFIWNCSSYCIWITIHFINGTDWFVSGGLPMGPDKTALEKVLMSLSEDRYRVASNLVMNSLLSSICLYGWTDFMILYSQTKIEKASKVPLPSCLWRGLGKVHGHVR